MSSLRMLWLSRWKTGICARWNWPHRAAKRPPCFSHSVTNLTVQDYTKQKTFVIEHLSASRFHCPSWKSAHLNHMLKCELILLFFNDCLLHCWKTSAASTHSCVYVRNRAPWYHVTIMYTSASSNCHNWASDHHLFCSLWCRSINAWIEWYYKQLAASSNRCIMAWNRIHLWFDKIEVGVWNRAKHIACWNGQG